MCVFAVVPGSPVSVTGYVNVPYNQIKSQMWKKRGGGCFQSCFVFCQLFLEEMWMPYFFFSQKPSWWEKVWHYAVEMALASCAAVCSQQDQGFSPPPWNAETMANSQVRMPTDILEELVRTVYMVFILLCLTQVWRVSPSLSGFVFSHAITVSHLREATRAKKNDRGFYSLFKGAFFSVHCPFDWFQSLFRKLFQGT